MKANKNQRISQHTHIITVEQLKSHSSLWHVYIYYIMFFFILICDIDAKGFQVSFYPSKLLLLPFLVSWVEQLRSGKAP